MIEAVDGFILFKNKASHESIVKELQYHYNLGYTYFKMADYEFALKAFQKVVDLQKYYPRSKST